VKGNIYKMKNIIANIKPCMLDDVVFALHKISNFPGATISDVRSIGCYQQEGKGNPLISFSYPAFVHIEIFCSDQQAEEIVSTIKTNAHTGGSDDGGIFISSVDKAVNIQREI
jgi:nitrogen regulatory protein PII